MNYSIDWDGKGERDRDNNRWDRPAGANADDWHLFLTHHACNRPTMPNGLTFVAVQIAEAIDAAMKPGERCDICGRVSS